MKKTVALLLLLAVPAQAQVTDGDAPLAVKQGEVAPLDGVFLTTDRAGRIFLECETAKRNAAEFEKVLKEQPPPAAVYQIVIAAGLGVAAGAALAFLTLKIAGGK